jgi:uncharacterized protein YggE
MQDRTEASSGARRRLKVTGRGVASVDADLVVLAFGITGRDPSYSASVEKLNERVDTLRSDLEAAGVDRTKLKTTGFSVRSDRRYDRDRDVEVFLGYRASHGLTLELAFDGDHLNRVLGRAAQSASEASLRISFGTSDPEKLRRMAMRAAVLDTRESAQVLAEAAGVELGEVEKIDYSFVEVRTRSFSYNLAEYDASVPASPAPDVEPEALEQEESVTVVYRLA